MKVTDFDFFIYIFVKGFVISYHPNSVLDLVYIWYDYRFWFKISFSAIPTHTLTSGHMEVNEVTCRKGLLEKMGGKAKNILQNTFTWNSVSLDILYRR